VYGGPESDQFASVNDQPLEFGAVIESGPQLAPDTAGPLPTHGEPELPPTPCKTGGILIKT